MRLGGEGPFLLPRSFSSRLALVLVLILLTSRLSVPVVFITVLLLDNSLKKNPPFSDTEICEILRFGAQVVGGFYYKL